MKLHLGVIDTPYTTLETPAQKRARKRKGGRAPTKTTGDVAEILEAKYAVMGTFFDLHQREIAKAMERGVQGAVESILAGAPATIDPFGEAGGKIKTMFDRFLTDREMERAGVAGVPTAAAVKGVSHRFKNRRGSPGRPSFIDTGLYENTFRAWVTR